MCFIQIAFSLLHAVGLYLSPEKKEDRHTAEGSENLGTRVLRLLGHLDGTNDDTKEDRQPGGHSQSLEYWSYFDLYNIGDMVPEGLGVMVVILKGRTV